MTANRVNIRLAVISDVGSLIEVDSIAQRDSHRRAFIENATAAAQCWIATERDYVPTTAGYGVLTKHFFERNFVPLIVVVETARRRGVAVAILRELEAQCRGTKLFTPTNTSNAAMRPLLLRCGFVESGYIENLDEGDPELIFVKLATI